MLRSCEGDSKEEILDSVQRYMEQGYQYIRVQQGGYGGHESSLPRPIGAKEGLTLIHEVT